MDFYFNFKRACLNNVRPAVIFADSETFTHQNFVFDGKSFYDEKIVTTGLV